MFCLSRDIVIYQNEQDNFIISLNSKGCFFELPSDLFKVFVDLSFIKKFDNNDFHNKFNEYTKSTKAYTKDIFNELVDLEFFISAKQSLDLKRKNKAVRFDWQTNGWAAAKLFHDSVVYTKFMQGDESGWLEQIESMKVTRKTGIGPSAVKEYKTGFTIPLNEENSLPDINFFEVLMNRRTCRGFNSSRKIDKSIISKILFYSAKAQKIHTSKYFGKQIFRTSPSGGARHPVEIYPQIIESNDCKTGSYYYNHLEHKLIRISGTNEKLVYEISQKQVRLKKNYIVFIITARFIRNFWKYRYAKSYIFTMLDVGHFVQTLILTCEALGLHCFLTPALDVSLVQDHLKLENIYDECPVYFVVAGYK